MILLHVRYKLRPSIREEFITELKKCDLAGRYRKEPGNITYEYFVPLAEEDVLFVVDAWEDEAALEAHMTCPVSEILQPLKKAYVLETYVTRYDI